MPSILDPMSCGFAKIRCYHIFTSKKIKSVMDNESPLEMKHREFNSSFNELESFRVNQRVFRSFDRIVKNLQKLGKVNKVGKAEVAGFFSLQRWVTLTAEQKKEHSVFNCKGCTENLVYKSKLALFRNVYNSFKVKAFSNLFEQSHDGVNDALRIAERLEKDYQKVHNHSFKSVLSTAWEVSLPQQSVNSANDNEKKQRNLIAKEYGKEMESIWAKSEVERYVTFFIFLVYRSHTTYTLQGKERMLFNSR